MKKTSFLSALGGLALGLIAVPFAVGAAHGQTETAPPPAPPVRNFQFPSAPRPMMMGPTVMVADGGRLFAIAGGRIMKIDENSLSVIASKDLPSQGFPPPLRRTYPGNSGGENPLKP